MIKVATTETSRRPCKAFSAFYLCLMNICIRNFAWIFLLLISELSYSHHRSDSTDVQNLFNNPYLDKRALPYVYIRIWFLSSNSTVCRTCISASMAPKRSLLDLDDDDNDIKLEINRDYAHKYSTWRQKEELQKCKCFVVLREIGWRWAKGLVLESQRSNEFLTFCSIQESATGATGWDMQRW